MSLLSANCVNFSLKQVMCHNRFVLVIHGSYANITYIIMHSIEGKITLLCPLPLIPPSAINNVMTYGISEYNDYDNVNKYQSEIILSHIS